MGLSFKAEIFDNLYDVTVYWDNIPYCNKTQYDIATPRVPLPD